MITKDNEPIFKLQDGTYSITTKDGLYNVVDRSICPINQYDINEVIVYIEANPESCTEIK